jgi:hypothetical protein
MKKLSVFLAIILALTALGSCTKAGVDKETTSVDETTTVNAGETGNDSTSETTEDSTEDKNLTNEVPKTLKILAIGNSFSTDAMQYLYDKPAL